jgi:hypothetical protein
MHLTIAGIIALLGLAVAFWKPIMQILKSWWETMESRNKEKLSRIELSRAEQQQEEVDTEDEMLAFKERASMGHATTVLIPDELFVDGLPSRNPDTIRKILRRWRHERGRVAPRGRFAGRF